MEQKADLHFVEPLLKKLKQLNSNKQCVYPGCSNKPIGSHIIAESVLKVLAPQGQILTWERTEGEVLTNAIRGHSWDHVRKEPKKVGIKHGAKYLIFCQEHDNSIFGALENPEFMHKKQRLPYEPRQVALLAYRALCYKTWNPNVEEKLKFFLPNKDGETVLQWSRLLSLQILLEARQKFYDMLKTENYNQMRWIKRICHIDPCLACTDAIIPYDGDDAARSIASGDTTIMPEDVVTFTFFPEKRLNASVCIVTWFKDNERGEKFKDYFNPATFLEEDIRHNIITNTFRMSLFYTSPIWWDTLTPEQRKNISALRLSEPQFLYNLVEGETGN